MNEHSRTNNPADEIESLLMGATRWEGGPTELWSRALSATGRTRDRASSRGTLLRRRVPGAALGVAVLIVGAIIFVTTDISGGTRSKRLRLGKDLMLPSVAASSMREDFKASYDGVRPLAGLASPDAIPEQGIAAQEPPSTPGRSGASAPAADRSVIRKATLDLAARDIRGTFLKSQLLINEALGEYIETSSLTGEGKNAYGTVTLRVAAARLSEALNGLRQLGEVVSESATGQDVTQQVVDLDARLRNEQRVETELLELLSSRKDAPLKEVLELRDQIARIRGEIELLTAQRQNVGRMVSLATILVTIRAEDARFAAPSTSGIGDYFSHQIADSWRASLRLLTDAVGLLMRVIVGGAVWWAIAAGAVVLALGARRRAVQRAAAEPAPAE